VARNRAIYEIVVRLIHRCCLIQSLYMTPPGPPCLVHDHEELIEHPVGGNAREALRVHNRHFDQIESSLMLEETRDKLSQMGTMFSALAT
jgi:DNA-binding GntR family transcriptional regulator